MPVLDNNNISPCANCGTKVYEYNKHTCSECGSQTCYYCEADHANSHKKENDAKPSND